ncbi:YdcF family protein [candidate division WOR-3 bacterium]|nr:YdcF family protein [candidate division WOR-3 bacterium]
MVENKDAVIILGCKDKELTKKRVKFAELKLKNSDDFRVIFSGTKEEVGWMKKYSKLKAIPEDNSTTTPQNLINSKKFIDNAGKIWIVTDQSHVFRTRYLAKKILVNQKVEVIGIKMPAVFNLKQLYYEFSRLMRHVLGIE